MNYTSSSTRERSFLSLPENLRRQKCASYLAKTVRDEKTGCRLWTGSLTKLGYARALILVDGKYLEIRVHRLIAFMYLLDTDEEREAKDHLGALHTCDVRHCIEPTHLYLGTQEENIQDSLKRGRYGHNPYEPALIVEASSLHSQGFSYAEIAKQLGLNNRITAMRLVKKA